MTAICELEPDTVVVDNTSV